MTFSGPRAVGRVTDVLELLAVRREGLSLTALANHLDVPKASLSALLKPLALRDYVILGDGGRYHLGAAAYAFARQVTSQAELIGLTHPLLEKLASESGETALLATLLPDEMVAIYIDKAESDNPIRYTVPVGLRRELHASSTGKVILAFQSIEYQDAYLARRLARFTAATLVEPEGLRAQLEGIRRDGFVLAQDERTAGASGIAVPVWGAGGLFLGGLSLAGPSPRIASQLGRFRKLIEATGRKISDLLGRHAHHGIATSAKTTAGGMDAAEAL